jgi:N-acetylglucosamine-6-phosphate deacetylase
MSRIALTNGTVLMPDGKWETAALLIEDTRIVGVVQGELPGDAEIINVSGCSVVPGFIDTHAHGGAGHNFMESTRDAVLNISRHMLSGGTTSWLATTTSASLDDMLSALQYAAYAKQNPVKGEIEIVGVHLEGPYVNPNFRGAHSEPFVRESSISELETLWDAGHSVLRVMTLAPEIRNGLEAAEFMSKRGVKVSMGHTGASYEETKRAIAAGVCRGTHLFNAMPPIHHRNPGPIPALLENTDIFLEMIVDGFHVDPAIIGMIVRQAEGCRAVLITDSSEAAGMGEGIFKRWKGVEVVVKDGQCRTLSGSFAGSILTMDQGVRNLVNQVGLSLAQAVRMATENPARSIGIFDRKGSLEAGKDADIVVLDDDLSVRMTIVRGQAAYANYK